MKELVEGVQRTRFGVNGGRSILIPGARAAQGLQQRLADWLLEIAGSGKRVRSQPLI